MSARSVSISWGSPDDAQINRKSNVISPAESPVLGYQPSTPPLHSKMFFSFNNASNNNNNNKNNNSNGGADVGGSAGAATLVAAHHLEWLQPWRTSQDCREGGLALLSSMQEILTNVERARQSSMQELYVPLRGSPTSTSSRGHDANDEVANNNNASSPTLRLSMRNSKRRVRPSNVLAAQAEVDAEAENTSNTANVNNSGNNNYSNTSGGGSFAGSGAAYRSATLMDYMVPGSSTRTTSHMWLDDSRPSLTTPPPSTPPDGQVLTPASQHLASDEDTQRTRSSVPGRRRGSLQSDAESKEREGRDANFTLPTVLPKPHEGEAITPADPTSTQPTPHTATRVLSSPPAAELGTGAAVPAIAGFDELKARQEYLLQVQEAHQPPHPRSEAAQKKRRALLHSSASSSSSSGNDEDGADASPRGASQTTARLSVGGGDGTARPAAAAAPPGRQADAYLSLTDTEEDDEGEHDVEDEQGGYDMIDEEEEEEEEESDRMSETNFGEGGHLACVPGDTLHNRYTLLKALGVGRSSRVWLAADLEQCSLARRQLIRELGEQEARRLFRPSERPMFVAIKVFRCSAMYSDCADYESKLSTFVKECVKLRQLRFLRSPPSRTTSLVVSPTSTRPVGTPNGDDGGFAQLPRSRTAAGGGRPRANSTSLGHVSPPQALVSPGALSNNASTAHRSVASASLSAPNSPAFASSTSTAAAAAAAHPSRRLTTFRDSFTVEGPYGTHRCLVMDVLGSGVDKAINETHLAGFPSEVARSILLSSLQGLSVLAACNVIHTDLKPENLLFTDLEADVAAEMSSFQSSQLHTGCRSGLWSSFTHKRENLLEYSQRKEQESASQFLLTSHSNSNSNSRRPSSSLTHMDDNERSGSGRDGDADVDVDEQRGPCAAETSGRGSSYDHTRAHSQMSWLSNNESVSMLANTRAPHPIHAEESAELSGKDRSSSNSNHPHNHHSSSSAAAHNNTSQTYHSHQHAHAAPHTAGRPLTVFYEATRTGPSGLTSPVLSATRRGRGSATSTPVARARRPAYEVRVSDFGLSFITPPCLRAGVKAVARYTADVGITEDDLIHDDPLSQLQWLFDQQQQRQQQQLQLQQQQSHPFSTNSNQGSSGSHTKTGLLISSPISAPSPVNGHATYHRATAAAGLSPLELNAGTMVGSGGGVTPSYRQMGRWDAGVTPEWAEVEFIDEAELRALQQEEAAADEAHVRQEFENAEGIAPLDGGDDARTTSDRSTSPETVTAAATDVVTTAVAFTSVLEVGGGAAARAQPREAQESHDEEQHATQPAHTATQPQHTTCSISHSSHGSSDDSLRVRRVTASATVDSVVMETLLHAPPAALRTASYHSPVSHPLTAQPSAAMNVCGMESAHSSAERRHQHQRHADDAQMEGEEEEEEGHRTMATRQTDAAAAAATVATTATPGVDQAFAVKSPSSLIRPPALKLTTFADPRNLSNNNHNNPSSDSGESDSTPTAAARRKSSALPSPRVQRRSPTSALASQTGLRRLELEIIRNQRYTRGATIQSREYRSPEVLLGNFFLPSCDVWSVGCIAYELITGRFLIDCIGDREHFGRQLARHLRREQRKLDGRERRRYRHDGASSSSFDEDEEAAENGTREDGAASDSEVEWNGQPIYVDDNEQDLDVFHLKSIMRLLGPPPISFLNQRPLGLYVDDYFDECGDFKFWEDGEAEDAGVGLAELYRRQELRYWGRRRRSRTDGDGDAGLVGVGATFSQNSPNAAETLDGFECHIRDYTSNGEDFEEDDTYDRASSRSRPYSALQRVDAAMTGNTAASHFFSSSSVPGPAELRNSPSTDATPSMLSMTPRSAAPSAVNSYLRCATPYAGGGAASAGTSAGITGAAAAAGGGGSGGGVYASGLSGTSVGPARLSPQDTRNYPIETSDWREVRQIIRDKLKSDDEARDFEKFLAKCLQWDPAQRATAAELLADDWIVKYSHKIAETYDSDADDDEKS